MIARRLWFSLALASCTFACSSQRPAPASPRPVHGVCFMPRHRSLAAQPLRPQDWLKLLVKLELGREAIVALRDCTGQPIREPVGNCRQASEPGARPVPAPIRQASVIERSLNAEQSLLWVVSHRLPSGEGFGPLALARRTPLGVEVEALGNLSMRTERVKLELWRVRNETLIMASGEVCRASASAANSGNAKSCRRAVRMFVQRRGALVEAPLLSYQGRCVQPTPLELEMRQQVPIAGGLRRNFELSSALSHDARQIRLEERLIVRDSDPNLPLAAAREVQRIEATRFIRVSAGRLYTQQRPLWNQALPKLMPANNGEPNSAGRAMTQR